MALTAPFATTADLTNRWRSLSTEETTRAGFLLTDASELILAEDKRGILTDLTDPAPPNLVRVVCAMVKRAMIAGATASAGVSQTQQAAGPFSVSATYSNPTGDLYLTAADRRSLGFTRQRAGGFDQWAVPE